MRELRSWTSIFKFAHMPLEIILNAIVSELGRTVADAGPICFPENRNTKGDQEMFNSRTAADAAVAALACYSATNEPSRVNGREIAVGMMP